MRWAGKFKNDSSVARSLGVTPQAFSNYKKKDAMPSRLVVKFAEAHGLSMDWLITGKGPMYKAERTLQESANEELAYITKMLKILRGEDEDLKAALMRLVDSLSHPPAEEAAIEEKKAG